ncbi:hypothetical protein [Paenibacillus turpanensis]|uniref:hypothetical protein n=1 Tax=Paenibacillus turpanensis TaxID=2689078 RepID=UPI00140A82B1|nr:hypothetical protein [Paenibacillus turpanensis]
MKQKGYILAIAAALLIIFGSGCSKSDETGAIAILSKDEDSELVTSFTQMFVGELLHYHLTLPQANRSWMTIWAEVYQKGSKIDLESPVMLSYGLSTKEKVEGSMGIALFQGNNDKMYFSLHAPGVRSALSEFHPNPYFPGIGHWENSIGEQPLQFEAGKEEIIGGFRGDQESLRTYSMQNPEHVANMIKEDDLVILFKMKVELK